MRGVRAQYVLTLATLLLSALPAPAQSPVPRLDGERVRVRAPWLPAPLFGKAAQRQPGTFVVSTPDNDAQLTTSLASVERIDVSHGRRRILFASAGLVAGTLIGGAWGAHEGGAGDPEGFGALFGTLAGASAGAIFGAVTGFAFAPERWETIHSDAATDSTYTLALKPTARVKQLDNGRIAVRGERNRKAGIIRGALILGGIGLVFGGIDAAQGEISGGEYIGTVASNAVFGGAVGYLISPRGWQVLPRHTQ